MALQPTPKSPSPKRTESGEFSLVDVSDEKTETKSPPALRDPESPSLMKGMMRGMFKADHPYRTRLGLSSVLNTSAAGVLNTSFAVTSISSTQEWSSIDALFDEAFVHAMHLTFSPVNRGGAGTSAGAAIGGTPTFVAGTGVVISVGLQFVSLFANAGTYNTATAMLSNPNISIRMSDAIIRYAWRNNVRFDPHGLSLGPASSQGWQGWFPITASANLGGAIQIRTMDDQALGDGSHAFTLGHVALVYDVSFRTRA
jgi:hypothetical protein